MQNVTLTHFARPSAQYVYPHFSRPHASHFSSQFFVFFRHPNILHPGKRIFSHTATNGLLAKVGKRPRRTLGQLLFLCLAAVPSVSLAECARENWFPSLLACNFLGRLLSQSYITVVHLSSFPSVLHLPSISPAFTSQLHIIHTSYFCRFLQRPAIPCELLLDDISFSKETSYSSITVLISSSSIHGALRYQDCTSLWYFYPIRPSLFHVLTLQIPCRQVATPPSQFCPNAIVT